MKADRRVILLVKKIKAGTIIAFIALCLLLIRKMVCCNISSVEDFQTFMQAYGPAGPIMLTVIQAIQVVIPVLPGYLGCAVGAISYGPWIGFLCNYIGITAGSIIAFFLAMRFGQDLVTDLFSPRFCNKWQTRLDGKPSYSRFLFLATLLPMFPDDFLCYFSGLINMNKRKFIWIIILGKPWCILAYSIFFGMIK